MPFMLLSQLRDDGLLISADRKLVGTCEQHGLGDQVASMTDAVERMT
jgi:hypothetical protein